MKGRILNMRKKIFTIVLLVIIASVALFGYKIFLSPEGSDGYKNVTIQVIIEKEDINETFEFKTDHAFLIQLLNEKKDELGLDYTTYDMGSMITGMMDYTANENESEYFHIYVNESDAVSGPDEIPLNDNDNYKFELKKW